VVTLGYTSGATFATTNLDMAINVSDVEAAKQAAELAESNAADSEIAAAEDRVATGQDATATAQDRSAASISASASLASEALAEKWASEAEDTEVSSGLYSAFHYAQKAAAFGDPNQFDITADQTVDTRTAAEWMAALLAAQQKANDNTSDILNRAKLSGGADANFTLMPQVGGDPIVSFKDTAKLFRKSNSSTVLFTKTGNFTVDTSQDFYAEAGGSVLTIASGTAITMPIATTGTDYAVWLKTDGSLQATTSFTSPPATDARKIGGFHYAPGSNAFAQAGGNSTPQINEYSFWDLNYRPSTDDPRGMTLVAGGFWSDIYLLNTNPDVNGTSKYNETIADGSSPPVIPATLGGNGSTTYGSLTWFEAMSIATAMGKKAFTQPQFMTAMYGVTEATDAGSDPGTTGLDAPRTSRWGVMQATGNLRIWAQDRGGNYSTGGWNANTDGFGSEYNAPNVSLLGGFWNNGVNAGSRFSDWGDSASGSYTFSVGMRLVCDHLQLD